jgi:hypothetical protein
MQTHTRDERTKNVAKKKRKKRNGGEKKTHKKNVFFPLIVAPFHNFIVLYSLCISYYLFDPYAQVCSTLVLFLLLSLVVRFGMAKFFCVCVFVHVFIFYLVGCSSVMVESASSTYYFVVRVSFLFISITMIGQFLPVNSFCWWWGMD